MNTRPDTYKELFKFVEGDSDFVYTITNSDQAEVLDGDTYIPLPVARTEFEGKGEMARQTLTVTLPLFNEAARRWFVSSLDFPLTVTVFSISEEEPSVEWKGRLASVSPKKESLDFVFESVFTSMRRIGLRQRYQLTCPHALYGAACKVNKELFDVTGAITFARNARVDMPIADTFEDGYFTSGIFEDNRGNLRFIVKHVGDRLTLIRPMNPLLDFIAANGYAGLTGRIFPGCNRSMEHCNSRFNNLANFGGFPFIPGVNPFGNNTIA